MAQHDYDIANGTGAAVRADINAMGDAIVTLNGGTTAPSVTFPHMLWYDETANTLKQRDGANTTWNLFFASVVSGPGVAVSGNLVSFNGTTGLVVQDSGLSIDTSTTLSANSDTHIASQKAVKTYIDNAITGLKWKSSVIVATTTAGTLATSFANGSSVDGVTIATGQRILIKNQATTTDNGIYTVNASGAPTRATDSDTGAEIEGAAVFVEQGTSNSDTAWVCTTNGPITLGTTALAFAQFAGAGTYVATGGLGISGNSISITDAILTALRGVSAAANTVPYFTGASAMAVATLTAYGITLIAAANAAAAKTLLALVKGDVGLGNVDNTSDLTKWAATKTLTNTTFDAAGTGNALSDITLAMLATNVADTDGTLAANSTTRVATQSATKTYADTKIASSNLDTDGTLSANSNTRVASQQATKTYVDNAITGLKWKQTVIAATTTNGTIATAYANGQTIDGIVLATGNRILLKNQTTASDNGIYTVNASGAPTRSTDADTGTEIEGAAVFVEQGTINNDTGWVCSTNGPITLGTTALAFAQFNGGGTTYSADGTTLQLVGSQFSVKTAGIANSNLANMAADTLKGNNTGSSAAPADLTVSQVTTLLSLNNVNNTADSAKPVSTAQAAADLVAQSQLTGTGPNTQTGTSYTFVLTDAGGMVEANNASSSTYTIPPNSSVAFPVTAVLNLTQIGAGIATWTAGAGVTLQNKNGLKTSGQWAITTAYQRAANVWVIGGDTST